MMRYDRIYELVNIYERYDFTSASVKYENVVETQNVDSRKRVARTRYLRYEKI